MDSFDNISRLTENESTALKKLLSSTTLNVVEKSAVMKLVQLYDDIIDQITDP